VFSIQLYFCPIFFTHFHTTQLDYINAKEKKKGKINTKSSSLFRQRRPFVLKHQQRATKPQRNVCYLTCANTQHTSTRPVHMKQSICVSALNAYTAGSFQHSRLKWKTTQMRVCCKVPVLAAWVWLVVAAALCYTRVHWCQILHKLRLHTFAVISKDQNNHHHLIIILIITSAKTINIFSLSNRRYNSQVFVLTSSYTFVLQIE